jgi:hypothetical protein
MALVLPVPFTGDYTRLPGTAASSLGLGQNRGLEREDQMKFKVEIDCTPDEARAFFGLPNVKPLQEALMPEVEERLRATLKAMDPEAMLKSWLPATLKGFEQLQQMFFANMPGARDKK